MTSEKPTKNYQELREATERKFVLEVLAPKWKRGDKGHSLREIAKDHGLSHEQVRRLLIKYDVYE